MIEIVSKKKIGDETKVAVINYDFGKDIAEMIKKFGEDVVFTNARGSFKITAQSVMRRYLESGLDEKAIAEKMSGWKPGVTLERTIDPVAVLMSKWGSMSEEERSDVLKKLKSNR